MRTSTPPVILVLLGFCIGTGFGWLISFGRPGPVAVPVPIPDTVEHPNPSIPIVGETTSPAPVVAPDVVVGDWRLATDEIREYSGDIKEFDAILDSKIKAFPENPTAKVSLLFAAVEWAERVNDSSASSRKRWAAIEFHQYWNRAILWEIEGDRFAADMYKDADRTDKHEMEEFCLRDMKRMCEEHATTYYNHRVEGASQWARYYIAALTRLGSDGRKLDVLWKDDSIYHDTRLRRIYISRDSLLLSEMLRSPPEYSAFSKFVANAPLSAEDRKKVEDVRELLIRMLDQEAEANASVQKSQIRSRLVGQGLDPIVFPTTTEDPEELPPYDPEKANKEYRDLTADPPLPKPGEKGPPKPPEEKLVPYLKDPINKDPKANGLGLSLETLTDVVRADLGPLPFPLPLRLTGLEGARNPPPQPPGMISDRAKTQLTYKPRRALIAYLKKRAGRDIPDNYGKVDAPLLYWASLEEYMAHKDNKQEVYFLIGRNLEHAQRLILADPIQIRRSGVGLAEVATMFLLTHLDDKPLAMAIMDLYVMPYLHLGHKRREDHLSKANLLVTAMAVYSWSDFPDKLQLAAEEATRESGDQNGQDAGRFAIAKALVRQQKTDEAIVVLGQITDPSLVGGAKGYIASIRKEQGGVPKP